MIIKLEASSEVINKILNSAQFQLQRLRESEGSLPPIERQALDYVAQVKYENKLY